MMDRVLADSDFEEDELYLTLQNIPPPAAAPSMPPTHFLSIARSPFAGPSSSGATLNRGFDTSTVAAADFDVDSKTGFMPPKVPVVRLGGELEVWERIRDAAVGNGEPLTLGVYASNRQQKRSTRWRQDVESMPTLSVKSIQHSEVLLRRAHSVLTFILHFYIHSQPPLTTPQPQPPINIPPCLSVPLIALSKELVLPPILTYSDNVLYNWTLIDPKAPVSISNIAIDATFSLTPSEKHFYITSARIEIVGVEALELMRSCMDEAFIADTTSLRRITDYLHRLARVIDAMAVLLMAVRDECDPHVFFSQIRPWFKGWEPGSREWFFEGVHEEDQKKYSKMSGPSAGQSSLIHALDVFLGVDHTPPKRRDAPGAIAHDSPTFLMMMEMYMPRHHRAFLQHLRGVNQTHVRTLITSGKGSSSVVHQALEAAYDEAVTALKKLRDGHIRIATLYIVSQARKAPANGEAALVSPLAPAKVVDEEVRGTGGTSLVRIYEINAQGQSQGRAIYHHDAPVLDCCWSKDGTKVFSGGMDNSARMFDIRTGAAEQVAAHALPIKSVKWVDIAGGMLITGSWDKTVKYWSTSTISPNPMGSLDLPERVYAMDVSQQLLVIATAERHICIVHLQQPSIIYKKTISPLKWQTRTIACFPEGDGYAVGSIEGRVAMQWVEDKDQAKSYSFKCHRKDLPNTRDGTNVYSVNTVNFHLQQGSTFSTSGSDGNFCFWDRDQRMRLKTFDTAPGPIACTAFNRSGTMFAYAVSYDWSKGYAGMTPGHVNKVMFHMVKEDEVKRKPKK
ncbi:hypothetical protein FRB97_002672 [Tulasnella sp. 331]|nr:hypothetical protein FRB97_002672 [Tulasnella sp. 331]